MSEGHTSAPVKLNSLANSMDEAQIVVALPNNSKFNTVNEKVKLHYHPKPNKKNPKISINKKRKVQLWHKMCSC